MSKLYYIFLLYVLVACNSNSEEVVYLDEAKDDCLVEEVIADHIVKRYDIDCFIGMKIRNLKGEFLNGENYDITTSSSKYKVINLWFGQCKPCIAEIPGLNKLYDEYSPKVDFISICRNNIEDDKHIIDKYDFKFNHIQNSHKKIGEWFPNTGFPMTYIVNEYDIIIQAMAGGKVDSSASQEIYDNISKELIF